MNVYGIIVKLRRNKYLKEKLGIEFQYENMKIFLITFVALIFPISLYAQSSRDSISVYGNVMDSFTHEMLKGVRITIMRSDSTIVDEYTTGKEYRYGGYKHNFDKVDYLYLLRADYIFRFAKEGYITQYLNLYQKDLGRRESRRFLGEVLLKKVAKRREIELGEAEVRASKIRMVVKGDTLTYNADAFQLAEGSMLDGLIKLLPGFQLRDGQILVNGQYVSSLLVNGEDFFRGDPRVALENLPAYMVNKVKVYRKEHPWSHIANERVNKEELPLVVDVNLKREYAIGWVGNAGAGYGSNDRYLGRIFGLRFTDHSRLALYGNLNNTNDTCEPGTSGDWNPNGTSSGQTEMQTAGFEFLLKGGKNTWKYVGHAKLYHRNLHDQSVSSTETFQPTLPNNTFSRMRRDAVGNQWKVQTEQQYEVNKANYYCNIFGTLVYQHHRTNAWQQSAELAANPMDAYLGASLDSLFSTSSERLEQLLVNMQHNQQRNSENLWLGRLNASSMIRIPHTPDYLQLKFDSHVMRKQGTAFSDYRLRYGQATATQSPNEHQLRYAAAPEWKVDASFRARYAYRLDKFYISPYLDVNNSYLDGERNFYRLDRLGTEAPQFGLLPSTTAALLQTLDAPNSYTLQRNTFNTKMGVEWIIWLGGKWPSHRILIEPAVQWQFDHLTYHRDALHAHPHRHPAVFIPKFSWGFENCYLNYELQVTHPDLLSLLDYVDNADPLNQLRGNPDLQRSTTHKVTFRRSWKNWTKARDLRFTALWEATRNAIAHGQVYDAQTGVRTFMPRNVNGNWHSAIGFFAQTPLDAKKQTLFSTQTEADFRNSVDYVTERNTVRNFTLSEELRLNTKVSRHVFDWSIGVRYWNATSKRPSFATINSFDITYGLNAQIALPAGFSLQTDLKLYQRAGYSDASMNDLRFVANARLAKSFFHGRLGLALDGFDLFGGLSNVTKVINAQGIVERWHNSLPSYIMLQISYKLSKQPSKSKEQR